MPPEAAACFRVIMKPTSIKTKHLLVSRTYFPLDCELYCALCAQRYQNLSVSSAATKQAHIEYP